MWEPSEEPLIASGKFASFFTCSFGFCKTIAVMSGRASSGPYHYMDQDGEEQMDEETYFYPLSMMPGPRVIAIHQRHLKRSRSRLKRLSTSSGPTRAPASTSSGYQSKKLSLTAASLGKHLKEALSRCTTDW